jgi:PD-(D/E)XK nuclease superfamily
MSGAAAGRVRGRFDIGVTLDNGTFGIPDLKTARVKDAYIDMYARQLWAYAYAVEHPAPGKPMFSPVSILGLVVFQPDAFVHRRGGGFLAGDVRWVELKRDDAAFLNLLDEVLSVLELPAPPPPGSTCEFCGYGAAA